MAYYKSNVYAKAKAPRADKTKGHRTVYEKNKKKIIMSQNICGICGQPVDKTLKWPHPYSATADHIIPISKGGHPTDIENLQLAHNRCNRMKWDNLQRVEPTDQPKIKKESTGRPMNRDLPLLINWKNYNMRNTRDLREEILNAEKRGKPVFFEDI